MGRLQFSIEERGASCQPPFLGRETCNAAAVERGTGRRESPPARRGPKDQTADGDRGPCLRSGCAARTVLTAGKELSRAGGIPTNGHVIVGCAECPCHAGRHDMPPTLRVCIDARLTAETSIGVKHFIMGLAHGLSALDSSTERYLFLTYSDAGEWLNPRVSGSCSILRGPISPGKEAWKGTLRARFPLLARVWAARERLLAGRKVRVPE